MREVEPWKLCLTVDERLVGGGWDGQLIVGNVICGELIRAVIHGWYQSSPSIFNVVCMKTLGVYKKAMLQQRQALLYA